jgi:undecaprenyl-diphosphatase
VTAFQAALLGLIQGLTEFLPVSSTAHLRIAPALFGWQDAGAAYTAVLQLGTLAAVIGFFLRDLLRMVRALFVPELRRGPDARMLLYLVVGTVPIGIAGVLFKDAIEGPLRSLAVIGTTLIVVGLVMALVERFAKHERTISEITLRDVLIVGAGQALALIPGVSRSGITLACAMAIGLRRDAAARFSFLLSVPAVTAAGVFELPEVLAARDIGAVPLLVGIVVAGVSGYASIAWLIKFLRSRTTLPFVYYRVALGALLLTSLGVGWL